MKIIHSLILFLALSLTNTAWADVRLPDGFNLRPFAHIDGARSLVPVPELGAVFVGTRSNYVYVILDQDQNGIAEDVWMIADDLKVANGLAWKDGYLYVAEQHRLIRFFIGQTIPNRLPEPEILFSDFPDDRWHGWRYAAFGPDGALYVSIGVPCNICQPNGIEGTIQRFDPTSWKPQTYARGIRNSVGIEFHPKTGEMFFTDNGADHMGDDIPACELNRTAKAGQHFGYPYYGGGTARTYEFRDHPLPKGLINPVHNFQAHVAPLGVRFYTGERFPKRYKNGVFVAQHGSWNRSTPVGYKISFHPMNKAGELGKEEAFITGWLDENEDVSGRPVDMANWAKGRMLISDDAFDVVYILDYSK